MDSPRNLIDKTLEDIDFQLTQRVLFGPGRLDLLGELARELGFKKSLLVTDPGIEAYGHVERATRSLEKSGVVVRIFDGVEENPTTLHVARGVDAAKEGGVDSLIGMGGGSSMDCAKGINFILSNGGRMEDYWGLGKATKAMLPSMGVPTTSGTGSEAQSFALISHPETHQKMACGDKKAAFRAVILDPEVTLSMPAEVSGSTGLDAISHAVESFVTSRRSPISQAFSREAWKLLVTSFGTVLDDGNDLEARAAMLLGASLSGMAIENSMLGAAHSLANPLTAQFGVTHGAAVGLMLPHVVRFNGEVCGEDYRELSFFLDEGDSSPSAAAGTESVAGRIEWLRDHAGLPARLADCGVTEDRLAGLAEEAARQWTAQFNPRPVSANEMEELYRCAY